MLSIIWHIPFNNTAHDKIASPALKEYAYLLFSILNTDSNPFSVGPMHKLAIIETIKRETALSVLSSQGTKLFLNSFYVNTLHWDA